MRRCAADQGILFGLRIRYRVPFFEPDSKEGAKFVKSIRARVPIHSTVWYPHFNLTYLSFVQEINPSFDVFNIFIVIL